MSEIAEFFRISGVWAYLILGLSGLGLVAICAMAVITCTKRRLPAPAWFALPLLVVTVAGVAEVIGFNDMFKALSHATPDTRDALLTTGASIAKTCGAAGLFCCAILMVISTIAMGGSLLVGSGDDAEPSRSTGIATAALGVGLGLVLLGWALTSDVSSVAARSQGIILLLVGVGCGLSGLRRGVGEATRRRLATGRFATGAMAASAVIVWWLASKSSSQVDALRAFALATPDTRQELLHMGLDAGAFANTQFPVALGVVLLILVILVLGQLKHLFDVRAIIGAVTVGVFVGITMLPAAWMALVVADVNETWAAHAPPKPANFDALPRAVGVDGALATSTDYDSGCRVTYQDGAWRGCWDNERPQYSWGNKELVFELESAFNAHELARVRWFKGKGALSLTTQLHPTQRRATPMPSLTMPHADIGTVWLDWMMPAGHGHEQDMGSSTPVAMARLRKTSPLMDYDKLSTVILDGPDKNTWLIHQEAATSLGAFSDPKAQTTFANALEGTGSKDRAVLLVAGDHWTLQHLVSVCITVHDHFGSNSYSVDSPCVLAQESSADWLKRRDVKLQ